VAPAAAPRPTVYLDCTETLLAGLNTGIQRVVRNVVSRAPAASQALGVPCVPVFLRAGRFWIVEDPASLALARAPGRLGKARDRFVRLEAAYQQAAHAALGRWPGLERAARTAWDAPRALIKRGVRLLTRGRATRGRELRPAHPGPGDVLVLLDAFWTSGIVAALAGGAAGGAAIVPVIYDIIPLTHPQFFDPGMAAEFRAAFEQAIGLADAVLTDSAATLARVREYLAGHPRPGGVPLPGAHWYPGADLGAPRTGAETPQRAELESLRGTEYYLMVGTLEPRKGQLAVLDAFEARWAEGETARLVLAGRIGWRFGEIVRRIERSAWRDARLIALHDATDAELAWLYGHAAAVILASHEEGFGLPLVEAMHLGVPVIASDIPVFREVGGDYPAYFALEQPGALAAAMEALRQRVRSGYHPMPRPWPTWDEAAPELIRKALALHAGLRGHAAGR
jgi:alpha-1,2-rhamnosyltransferase